VNIPTLRFPTKGSEEKNKHYFQMIFTNITSHYPKANLETAFLRWKSDRMLKLAFTEKTWKCKRSVVIESLNNGI